MTLAEARPRNHTIGLALSVTGIVILVGAALAEVGGGLLLGIVGTGVHDEAPPSPLASLLMQLPDPTSVLKAVLIAACFVMLGEQLRRGNIGPNPNPPHTWLPKASNLSRFRPLGVGWHALWATLGLIVSLVLTFVPTIAVLTRGWPTTIHKEYDFLSDWQITGLFTLGISAAAMGSLYKKVHYRRLVARKGDAIRNGVEKSAFWEFTTYRWRIDIWLVGFAGSLMALVPVALSSADWSNPSDYEGAMTFVVGLTVVCVAIIALGLWMSSNFWRVGKPLGSAESYS